MKIKNFHNFLRAELATGVYILKYFIENSIGLL